MQIIKFSSGTGMRNEGWAAMSWENRANIFPATKQPNLIKTVKNTEKLTEWPHHRWDKVKCLSAEIRPPARSVTLRFNVHFLGAKFINKAINATLAKPKTNGLRPLENRFFLAAADLIADTAIGGNLPTNWAK